MNTKLQWNANVLEDVFRELYSIEMATKPDFISKMYGVESSTKDTESVDGIGGEGLFGRMGTILQPRSTTTSTNYGKTLHAQEIFDRSSNRP